ncbi:unnamed protein product, partial [Ectocarpus fasciculatus]
CIDRGPDKLRPPVAYEHWNDTGNGEGRNRSRGEDGIVKKTANFARPSSVSADTPNFFKVPGVAINSSSAITGVEAVSCRKHICTGRTCRPSLIRQTYQVGGERRIVKSGSGVTPPKNFTRRW